MLPGSRVVVFAQNLGEYGALSGLAAGLQSFANRVEIAMREPQNVVLTVLVALVLGYFLLRRR
jgi:hypothetical protein